MDDILIYATTIEELKAKTIRVLKVLQQHNLFLKPAKCQFTQREVEFLGITVQNYRGDRKLVVTTDKVSAIRQWLTPTTPKHIRQFLGFCNFYRKFVPNFANIVKPLLNLMHI